MKPLESIRKILEKLCMHSLADNESQCEKLMRILFSSILFSLILSILVSSAVFISKSADLEDKLYGLFQSCGSLVADYSFIVAVLLRRKIAIIFENLTKFYDECKTFFFI